MIDRIISYGINEAILQFWATTDNNQIRLKMPTAALALKCQFHAVNITFTTFYLTEAFAHQNFYWRINIQCKITTQSIWMYNLKYQQSYLFDFGY